MNISAYSGVPFLGVTEIPKSYDFITVEFGRTDSVMSHMQRHDDNLSILLLS